MKNVEILLTAAEDKVNEMVAYFIPWYLKTFERPATAYDIEYYKIGIQCDMLKAFGKYVKPEDTIQVNRVGSDKGSVTYNVTVTRDGVDYPITTEMIVAGGYNIQCHHYRYISHTKLLSLNYNALAAAHQARMRKMTLEQRIKEERDRITDSYNRNRANYEKKINYTDEEILHNSSTYNFWKDKEFETLNSTAPIIESYPTKELYDAYRNRETQKVLEDHRLRWNPKELKYIDKNYQKDMVRLDKKLLKGLDKLNLSSTFAV